MGLPVAKAILAGQEGDWSLSAVLTRTEQELQGFKTLVDADAFFENKPGLIIDVAGPASLQQYGERALSMVDLWTVNATALADSELYNRLEKTGQEYGFRLRVLSGAIAGLDGVAALTLDENATVQTIVDVAPAPEARKILFKGSVGEVAKLFPDCVNVAVATGLAGSDLNRTQIEVIQPGPGEKPTIALYVESKYGQLEVKTIPIVVRGENIHMVTACIIAALRRENDVIWTG
jgi:aspartate dehydrogenase